MTSSSAVAIVNYNTREHLGACLRTVQRETPSEVIVVDNASSDGSVEMVQAEYPRVVLLSNKTNLGFAAAANQAIANCTAKYVLLLNSDILLQPGSLKALAGYLDLHPKAAIVGPRLVNTDGTLQVSCYPFPTVLNTLFVNSRLGRLIGYVPFFRKHFLPAWSHTHPRVVPWVKGAAMAIRHEAIEAVGKFDESFFMYFEEVDLCYRLAAAGWQVHFAPVTTLVHIGEASTNQHRTDMAVQLLASTFRFYQRHYSGIRFVALGMLLKGIILARWINETVCLHVTRDKYMKDRITADVAAWQRVLRMHWREGETLG
jgi:GT2 family glycosyltransferase